MNIWQSFALGFLVGSMYVIFVYPWLDRKLRR